MDVDSHHYETEAFSEIANFIENPVLRHEAKYQGMARGGVTSVDGSYQEIGGRITRYPGRKAEKVPRDAASRHHAHATLDGCHGRRHGLYVSDADAQPRVLPPRRGGSGPRLRLQ